MFKNFLRDFVQFLLFTGADVVFRLTFFRVHGKISRDRLYKENYYDHDDKTVLRRMGIL